jgi:galactokinase
VNVTQLTATLEAAGLSGDAARVHADRFVQLTTAFDRDHHAPGNWDAWFVPGRIEVVGKHTDYAGGRSLICAAERGLSMITAPRADGRLAITDTGRNTSLMLDYGGRRPDQNWATYPLTVLRRVRRNFPDAIRGADIVFTSDLPSAAGMSSSSALMIAVLLALVRANALDSSDRWRANIRSQEDLAAYAATIENGSGFRALEGERGVGTEGGSEDHTAILCSRPGELAQYAFCPTRRERTIRFPDGLVVAIGVSGVVASKTGNARDDYNRASQRVRRIVERWRQTSGRADASLAEAIGSDPGAVDQLREMLRADEALLRRLEQFIEESTVIVPACAAQLEAGDLAGFGATVARSQELAERLLGNQVPETIALVRAARESGALAASAFGAGFGGSVWALVERAGAPAFLDRWQNAYAASCPLMMSRALFFVTPPGPGVLRATESSRG